MAEKVRSLAVTGGTLRPGDVFFTSLFGVVEGPFRVASLHANPAAGMGWVLDTDGEQHGRCGAYASEVAARSEAARHLRSVLTDRMAAAEKCRRQLAEEEARLARLEGRPAEVG